MIDQSCKFFIRPIFLISGAMLLAANAAWAQAPAIGWSLDAAIRQIERPAKDFNTAMARVEMVTTADDGTEVDKSTQDGTTVTMTYTGMARNLDLKPELFKDKWPRGTKKIRK